MSKHDTFDRTWLETKVLTMIEGNTLPTSMRDLKQIIPESGGTIVCSVQDMQREGLVRVFHPSPRNDEYVEILPKGKAVLFHIMTSGKENS